MSKTNKMHRVPLTPQEYRLLIAYRALPRFAAAAARKMVLRWASMWRGGREEVVQ